jgi:hypothetical protein
VNPRNAPISHVTGRRQARALRLISAIVIATAATSLMVPGPAEGWLALGALVLVVSTPLLRVGWLIFRWGQEGDRRFVLLGVGLLTVVAVGAVASGLGLGR